jgi:hypothetical protein
MQIDVVNPDDPRRREAKLAVIIHELDDLFEIGSLQRVAHPDDTARITASAAGDAERDAIEGLEGGTVSLKPSIVRLDG